MHTAIRLDGGFFMSWICGNNEYRPRADCRVGPNVSNLPAVIPKFAKVFRQSPSQIDEICPVLVFPAGPDGDVSLWQCLFHSDLSDASHRLRQTDQLTGQDTDSICFSHNLHRHGDISGERNGCWDSRHAKQPEDFLIRSRYP